MANAPQSRDTRAGLASRAKRKLDPCGPAAQDEPLEGDAAADEERIDEASDESFPASDPPAFTSTHAGRPKRDAD